MMTLAAILYVTFAVIGLYGYQQARPFASVIGTIGGFCVWLYCHHANRVKTRELKEERRRRA